MATSQENPDVVDSWEDIDDLEILERKFPKTVENYRPSNGIIVLEEDNVRSHYSPPEPSVKILKRPMKHIVNENSCSSSHFNDTNTNIEFLVNCEWKKHQPVKTLQQREIEYAEARLRILGQAKSPEDELDERLSKLEFNPTTVTLLRSPESVSTIRLPRGPDGTKGFTLKR